MNLKALKTPLFGVVSLGVTLAGCGDGGPHHATHVVAQQAHRSALEGGCDLGGTWAMEFRIPIRWSGSAGLQSGEGEIVQWSLGEREHLDDTTVRDTIKPCGSSVPGYRSQRLFGNTLYGTHFPAALFDSNTLPIKTLVTHLTGSSVASEYRSEPLSIELGVQMTDPLRDSWPQATSDIMALAVDDDQDGQPGITVDVTGEHDDSFPPLGMLLGRARHARRFYVATRNIATSEGKIVSCDRFEGTATIPMLDGKPALHNRILGCETTDGGHCTSAEANFVSKWQPEYQLRGGSVATLVRVPRDTTCADVRAFNFRVR